jgi:hypothetical protein
LTKYWACQNNPADQDALRNGAQSLVDFAPREHGTDRTSFVACLEDASHDEDRDALGDGYQY